jgi:prevent-host-death family protein
MTNMARRRTAYVNIAEAKARLSELVDKAASGEEVLIARDNKPVARLVPAGPTPGPRKSGSARGQVWMADDFDDIPADFDDYTS